MIITFRVMCVRCDTIVIDDVRKIKVIAGFKFVIQKRNWKEKIFVYRMSNQIIKDNAIFMTVTNSLHQYIMIKKTVKWD